MTDTTPGDHSAEATAALAGMAQALDADGYVLSVVAQKGVVEIRIKAGPNACEECLMPEPVLEGMAADALASTALAGWEVSLAHHG